MPNESTVAGPYARRYAAMASAYRQKDPSAFNAAIENYKSWLVPQFHKELKKGRAEFYYNDVKAILHATIIYIFALVLDGSALLTLTVAPSVAVMFEVPTATPVASPPGEVMVATPRVAESHVT